MQNANYVHHWVNQNHDRLPQKAGFPQEHINEIHGAWGDSKNPVVKMSGSLRADLYEWFEEWCEKVDVCLALGTSLCGMGADELPIAAANNSGKKRRRGLVIVGLAATRLDASASVRIWGLLDDVLLELAEILGVGGNSRNLRSAQGTTIESSSSRRGAAFVLPENSSQENTSSKGENMKKSSFVPDPACRKRGQQWMREYPVLRYHVPMRKGHKDETPDQILKRTNPVQWRKVHKKN